MAKPNKAERVNAFIMSGAQERGHARVRAYLSKHDMGLVGMSDAAFSQAMSAIAQAMMHMYSDAMCDTLDVVEGRPLTKIES